MKERHEERQKRVEEALERVVAEQSAAKAAAEKEKEKKEAPKKAPAQTGESRGDEERGGADDSEGSTTERKGVASSAQERYVNQLAATSCCVWNSCGAVPNEREGRVPCRAPISESNIQKVRVLMLWRHAEREAKGLKESANSSEGDQEEDKPRKVPTTHCMRTSAPSATSV
jgi:hypothetical protein